MSTTSRIEDAQQQVVDVSRSMMRLSWAMTVFGAQQAANMVRPSRAAQSGARMAEALDTVATAIESQFGDGFRSAYKTGSAFALAPVDGMPSSELNRAMQELAMQPILFQPLKTLMPQMVASLTALMPGRKVSLARQECEAKMEVMELVQDVRKLSPPRDVYAPTAEIVAKGYALEAFAALWAIEGIGHELVEARLHRKEEIKGMLGAKEAGDLPDGSLTMLHAGVGLALAEQALDSLRPDSKPEDVDAALDRFVEEVKSASRKSYVGCALESLGLVTRHFYGSAMVRAVDRRLQARDEATRGFFWHGVGRAAYFSPENMLPGLSSPWPAVSMCDHLPPDDLARNNMIAGVAWGMSMVNLRRPQILEYFLGRHGVGFGDTAPFINGLTSAMIVRNDTTPDEPHLTALRAWEPDASDPRRAELWNRVVKQPIDEAIGETHPALRKKGRLGEIFRFQDHAELVA